MLLDAAEEWHQPPWVIEDEAPLVWIERWRVMREERAAVPNPKLPKPPKSTSQQVMSDGQQVLGDG